MDLSTLTNTLTAQARVSCQRRLLVLSGQQSWALETIQSFIAPDALIVGDSANHSCFPHTVRHCQVNQASQFLGQQHSQVVVDAFAGLSADAIGAISGTLAGGGLFILVCPALADWPNYADPDYARFLSAQTSRPTHSLFLQRLVDLIQQDPDAVIIQQAQPIQALSTIQSSIPLAQKRQATLNFAPCLNAEQAQAVAFIHKVSTGRARRPLVLTADRGRGKSAALGIAAAQLMMQTPAAPNSRAEGTHQIVLTAPSVQAVHAVFEHAKRLLPNALQTGNQLTWQGNTLTFFAPDQLIALRPNAHLLLIDEAAALPIPLLAQLEQHYKRVVFSSTLHGYEGSGRGFNLKFIPYLQRGSAGLKQLHLTQPIRWAANDPLERWVFDALLLNAQLPDATSFNPERLCTVRLVTATTLSHQPDLLHMTFSLLVCAHYQTKPSDLRALLDNPALNIMLLEQGNQVLGAAIVCHEGRLDPQLCQRIHRGERRAQGHLLPQSLLFHAGQVDAGEKSYARIMRIAVHPHLQQQGLGRLFVAKLTEWATREGYDFLGVSFGLTKELGRFWQQQELTLVHLGLSQDNASGCHSALMLQALQPQQQAWLNQCQQHFISQLGEYFSGPLRQLTASVSYYLLCTIEKTSAPSPLIAILQTYLYHHRPLEFVQPQIKHWLIQHAQIDDATESEQAVLVRLILQQQTWSEAIEGTSLTGKKAAQTCLKTCLQRYIPAPTASD